MNRKQRRAFHKKVKDARAVAADKLNIMAGEIDNPLHDGDFVKIDIDRVTKRKEYSDLQEEYRSFVESSRDKIFSVRLYRKRDDGFSAIVELDGVEKWLFWYGDLIRVQDGG